MHQLKYNEPYIIKHSSY